MNGLNDPELKRYLDLRSNDNMINFCDGSPENRQRRKEMIDIRDRSARVRAYVGLRGALRRACDYFSEEEMELLFEQAIARHLIKERERRERENAL